MEEKRINKKKILLIIAVLLLIGIISGVGTYTYFAWNSTGENKDTTVTVSSVDGLGQCNKISDNNKILLPIDSKLDGRIITVNTKQTLSEYAYITWTLTINSINREGTSTSGLKHQTFKYELVNRSTGVSYGTGDFSGVDTGSTITLSNDTENLAYNRDYTFALYLWIDGTKNTNPLDMLNQTFSFDLVCDLTGEATDKTHTTYENPVPASTYITNLYTEATKTQHTDSIYNITYNYAEDVNLMNDRKANMATGINDGNIRYYGANPDNYVSFNNELWRIIGVFNGRLKLIRKDSIGTYSWDTSDFSVNRGYGVNQWGASTHSSDDSAYDGADLMKLLNPGYDENTDKNCNKSVVTDDETGYYNCGTNSASDYDEIEVNNSLYWNAGSGKCYSGINSQTKNCDFSSSGLKDATSKAMIDEVTWYLGSNSKNDNPWDGNTTASRLYNWEHSNNSGIQCTLNNAYCSSDVRGTTTWVGKVGLMSPTDYAYATGGGTTHNLNTCLSTHNAYVADNSGIQNWANTYTDCKNNDWLLDKSSWQWTIAPRAYSSSSTYVFYVNYPGYVGGNYARSAGRVRPVVFLKPNVSITGGNGKEGTPYTLALY